MGTRVLASLVLLLLLAAGRGVARGQDAPAEIPVTVEATVLADDLPLTGLFTIRLDFAVEEDVGRALSVVVELVDGDRVLLAWNHAPTPPPLHWKKGQAVRAELLAPFPSELASETPRTLAVRLAFRDDATTKLFPPRTNGGVWHGRVFVAEVAAPAFEPMTDEARVAQVLAAADALAKAGRRPDAWAALEFALRRAPEDAVKYRFRNAMAKLGDLPARPLTDVEAKIVAQRIEEERRRYLRQVAGRMWDRRQHHGALRILQSIGGKLQEAADAAVVGALADARRAEREVQDLREAIWERLTDAEREEVEKEIEKLGRTRALLDRAKAWIKEGRHAAARRVLRDLRVTGPKDVASAAAEMLPTLETAMLDAIPAEELAAADAALKHPSFGRTATVVSHAFVFIGPKTLVEGIPAPSRTAFDLAYVFLTDLFGRRPNPEGDRVTVYFKELWDFGGGVGGGKIIDIGNARPDATGVGVDNGLLFHELTHCVDDTVPIHAGLREGLADFGATYAHEALSRAGEAQRGFATAAAAFKRDYLDRDLEYWRIPNYAVSAGFLLHFSEKHAKAANGHDWKPWRRFFRDYRHTAVRDGREPYLGRVFAHHLMRAFGPGVFDDLVAFRWPLVPSDRDALAKEHDVFAGGFPDPGDAAAFAEHPNSPLPRDLAAMRALQALRSGDEATARTIARDELGVIHGWRVVGPFEGDGADPTACVFPPEREVDFAKEYPQRRNIARWRVAGEPGPVQVDALGWVRIEYGYMDHTATYGLAHVTVDADVVAFVHARVDGWSDVAVFVNGERLGGFSDRGWNDATPLQWRGPVEQVPDAVKLPVTLRRGRNRVLVKVRNREGPAGFVVAIAGTDGKPVPGLRADVGPADPEPPRAEPRWRSAAKLDFRTKAGQQKLDVTVGAFEVSNKLLAGTSAGKGVAWRKYTVRPGFPKDSPSNLAWLPAKATEGVEDFRATFRLVPAKDRAPRLVVTFQGEGGVDGLSGWNLILGDAGGKCSGQLERYEELVYDWRPVAFPAAKEHDELVLTYVARRLTVTLNGATVLDAVPIRPIPGRSRIGFATWGAEPKFVSAELETAER